MEPYQELEKQWAEFNGLDPAGMVACSSGTAALHLALEALELPPGSEVLMPDLTMVACARAAILAGLKPVFVDCNERLLVDNDLAFRLWEDNVRAIMFVHVYGRRCLQADLRIANVARGTGFIIEDLAEAHGISPGPFSHAACWSFYKNKIVAGEEGGAVWFREKHHAMKARCLRSLGFTEAHDFTHVPRGHNYRMSNAHAQLILQSLAAYPQNLAQRRELESIWDDACPIAWRMPPRDAPWVYDFRIPGLDAGTQGRIIQTLQACKIAARHCFKPMTSQEEFFVERPESQGDVAAREVIYLPLTPEWWHSESRADRVFGLVLGCLREAGFRGPC